MRSIGQRPHQPQDEHILQPARAQTLPGHSGCSGCHSQCSNQVLRCKGTDFGKPTLERVGGGAGA